MKRWIWISFTLFALALSLATGYLLGYRSGAERGAPQDVTEREEAFVRAMNGVVLEGSFTAGSAAESLREERYTIESVEKIAGEYWVFRARLHFGGQDVAIPVPVRLIWAGDTPMVTLTDASLPGLGTFTARVVFYRDRYAGLWWGADASGHQFGRILDAERVD